ncbi:DUF2975 domain-containing protein [Pseudonocardia abyssalis]|uniref:DUF2975 domain-containing protein n=1 Tax=Pseudonocardia abyssalis TaxID=2792008 RepID=A0ABS6UZL8_9PSEU|nr:DUF2975 domain-containing protein [Pseudonocardia abyssalis]MBW0118823.1 DUF2975 domain-containing protein [Pseudonocardia abyssalis]MBW0137688.1 DUF2975 domain-containing protein [Pseudonocardia abyssalis]
MTTRRAVVPLGVLLGLLLLVVTVGQGAVVYQGWVELSSGESFDLSRPGWAMLAVTLLGLLCVQVVIVCTGKLLSMVARDSIFSDGALPWVDAIVRAIVAGWVLLLCAAVPVYVVAELDDAPGLAALHLVLVLVGAAVGLLMVVMRALLRQATTLRVDMEAVI